jgi:subtilisin family serine protease
MKKIMEPVEGRKRTIVTFKKKDVRKNKEEDKTSILQKSVEPHLRFLDVIKTPSGFAAPAVSAIDSSNIIAAFSSRGPEVALCAPGVNVYSTLPGNTYGYLSGTSMATPHVTGAAALCRGTHRYSPMGEVRSILIETATELSIPGKNDLYGYGRVNCVGATFSHKK